MYQNSALLGTFHRFCTHASKDHAYSDAHLKQSVHLRDVAAHRAELVQEPVPVSRREVAQSLASSWTRYTCTHREFVTLAKGRRWVLYQLETIPWSSRPFKLHICTKLSTGKIGPCYSRKISAELALL